MRMKEKKENLKSPKKKEALKAPKKIKILFTIVDRSKIDFYINVLQGFGVNMQTVLYGHGTAPTDLAKILGLADKGKGVILSIVPEDKISKILADYEDKYFKLRNGKGIAFTVPITSVIGVMVYNFLANNDMEVA